MSGVIGLSLQGMWTEGSNVLLQHVWRRQEGPGRSGGFARRLIVLRTCWMCVCGLCGVVVVAYCAGSSADRLPAATP